MKRKHVRKESLLKKVSFLVTTILICSVPSQKACFGFSADEEITEDTHELMSNYYNPPKPKPLSQPQPQTQAQIATAFNASTSEFQADEISPSGKSDKTRFKGHVEIDKNKSLRVSTIVPYDTGTRAAGSNLTVTGNLVVQGTTTLQDSTSVTSGTFTVGSNKMTVDSANGNTTIAGTTTLSNNLTVNSGTFTVGSNKMTVSASTGNTTIAGTTAITGNTTIGGTLGVTGASTLTGNTSVGGTLGVTGVTTLSNNASVGGTLGVTGASTLTGNTSVGGTLVVTGNTSLGNIFTINNQTNQITLNAAGLSYLVGEKNLSAIASVTPTSVLAVSFSNLLDVVTNISQGVQVKLKCFVSGIINSTQTEIFYEGNLYLFPGNASNAPCSITPISELSVTTRGTSTTLTSNITGNGTSATITLLSSQPFQSQTAKLFYEVTGSNLSTVS